MNKGAFGRESCRLTYSVAQKLKNRTMQASLSYLRCRQVHGHESSLLRLYHSMTTAIRVGVLALQGAFIEHIILLRQASSHVALYNGGTWAFVEVRTPQQLEQCDALIIPGGESTTVSLVAARSGLLEPLRNFVKYAIFACTLYHLIKVWLVTDDITPSLQEASEADMGDMCGAYFAR